MSERSKLKITMKLLSDAIPGSGFSIPGGEDIGVCMDAEGYPYLKGSTLKGLLRESCENWLAWTNGSPEVVNAIFGESGWSGSEDGRRLHISSLRLENPPQQPDDCFSTRVFTKLDDNGIVSEGSLRSALCIRRAMSFEGELLCDPQDVALLKNALCAIKWLGTLRSRGFGRVLFTAAQAAENGSNGMLPETHCIRYVLETELPVQMTDLNASCGNFFESRDYLTGAAIRGMVLSTLAASDPDWFNQHKTELLSERTRFLDALPNSDAEAVLPAIKGFYEDKAESALQSVLTDGSVQPGMKRAKLGSFCTVKDGRLRYWNAERGSAMRIKRNVQNEEDTVMYQTKFIEAGQRFEGYILLEQPSLAPKLGEAFAEQVWLGADRFEGYGRCKRVTLEAVAALPWAKAFGYGSGQEVGTTLYMLAMSPFAMLNSLGEPCGLDTQRLAELLGVGKVQIEQCSTSLCEFDSYNRTWQCRAPALCMYDRGSVFKLSCDHAPKPEALQSLQEKGLGIRREEGFGQILFMRTELFEGICGKSEVKKQKPDEEAAVTLRQKKCEWITNNDSFNKNSVLSKSQLGSIQALCEKAIANGGELEELRIFMDKNMEGRGARHGSRFGKINDLLWSVLDNPLGKTLGIDCADSVCERLRLLCSLFDYSRRDIRKGGI